MATLGQDLHEALPGRVRVGDIPLSIRRGSRARPASRERNEETNHRERKKGRQEPAGTASSKTSHGLTAEEHAAMRERAQKRYATFGFSDKANLEEGRMWPTTFALKELTPAEEARIAALEHRATS